MYHFLKKLSQFYLLKYFFSKHSKQVPKEPTEDCRNSTLGFCHNILSWVKFSCVTLGENNKSVKIVYYLCFIFIFFVIVFIILIVFRIATISRLPTKLAKESKPIQILQYGLYGHYHAHCNSQRKVDIQALPCRHLNKDGKCKLRRLFHSIIYCHEL